jgi:hypothetical protein
MEVANSKTLNALIMMHVLMIGVILLMDAKTPQPLATIIMLALKMIAILKPDVFIILLTVMMEMLVHKTVVMNKLDASTLPLFVMTMMNVL